jgi:hypothetical protein
LSFRDWIDRITGRRPQGNPGPAGSPVAGEPAPESAECRNDEVVGVLVAVDGELKGEAFCLFDGENTLGRAQTSDVVLASQWISREHAIVVHEEGAFAVVPLAERNRTYLNDREVDGAELGDGDALRLGRTTFRFRSIETL